MLSFFTRRLLKGYTNLQLEELRQPIHGEDSDLFDVLSYLA
jgi:type I restriction enzyme R subunit